MKNDVKAATVDDRRRVVLPKSCPPNAAVIIQQLDGDTWVIKRQRATKGYKVVIFAGVKKLRDDPDWEKMELRMAEHAFQNLPPLEE